MKRSMIVAAAALFVVGAAYPILALDGKKSNEPAKAVEKKDEGKTTEVKSSESMAKDTTPTPALTETKPAVSTSSSPSAADAVTAEAKDTPKGKVTDVAKDKMMDAATSEVKSAVNPTPSASSVTPTTSATKIVPNSAPATPNVAAPVAK